jgi:superfamily II DNA or RNA helicase
MSIQVFKPKEDLLRTLMVSKNSQSCLRAFEEISYNRYNIPFSYAISLGYTPKGVLSRKYLKFEGEVNSEEQNRVYQNTLDYLNKFRSCILSVHVGFGKTFIALKLAAHIGAKTLIVVPTSKKVLQKQWSAEILKFIPDAKIQFITSKSRVDDSCNFYIIGTLTLSKINFKYAQFVIVDELHLALSSEGFKSLFSLEPLYLLGLSATPYRLDGSDKLVELFFGLNQVCKKLNRTYKVHVIFTPYKYNIQLTEKHKVNWSHLLKQQAENKERNELIVDILLAHPNLKFLILSKRVVQIQGISDLCVSRNYPIQVVYENIEPKKTPHSLIGSIQKLGVGFSDDTFDALILAADVHDYFIQYFGRVMRKRDNFPVIYDIVDDCALLLKHYRAREKIYIETGGVINNNNLTELKLSFQN